jgi:hypothetical protein
MALLCRSPAAKRGGLLLATLCLSTFAATAYAQAKCTATGVMAGEKFSLNHCAVALLVEPYRSVTLWFNESPIAPQEVEAFHASAYPSSLKDGKPRTMVVAAFCPGGGQAKALAGAVKSMDIGFTHGKSAMAGAQWLIEAPKDFKVERISGDVRPGGNLSGRITGGRSSDGRTYAWDFTFDVTLPANEAASGIGCG